MPWASVGSADFDNRSFRLNDEANLNVIDREIAAAEAQSFTQDKARAHEAIYEQWMNRSAWQRGDRRRGCAGAISALSEAKRREEARRILTGTTRRRLRDYAVGFRLSHFAS